MREFLIHHAAQHPVSFHMPGHKGEAIFRRYGYDALLDHFVDCDITEISGADNLFQAEGIIRDTMDKYAKLYEVDRSYLLINGTSGGLIASVLAAVPRGGKLIMARNCHKSVFNALTLGDIQPVYAHPEQLARYGIAGEITADEIRRCLQMHPDASAVILPSPNYYGICSDIDSIAQAVHAAGKVLIVDQAHGAHLKFFHDFGCGEGMPRAAETCGADLVVASTHKTLASLTQSAILNLQGSRVDPDVLEDKLQAIESTSPSYILMSFLDINADLLREHGREAIRAWRFCVDWFYEEAGKISDLEMVRTANMDPTKINLDMHRLGISGAQLEQLLMQSGIYPELYTGRILMLMTGIGNTMEDMQRTVHALHAIAGEHACRAGAQAGDGASPQADVLQPVLQPVPLHAIPGRAESVPLMQAAGRICAGSIIPYPPGIPLVCPGEEITREAVAYAAALRAAGEKVIGINQQGCVLVGADGAGS